MRTPRDPAGTDDRAAAADDAGAVRAAIVLEPVLPGVGVVGQVGVLARDAPVRLGPLLERHVVRPDDALLRIDHFRAAADIDPAAAENLSAPRRLPGHDGQLQLQDG